MELYCRLEVMEVGMSLDVKAVVWSCAQICQENSCANRAGRVGKWWKCE